MELIRRDFPAAELAAAEAGEPLFRGRSKTVYRLTADTCFVRMVPSLSSFTFDRDEMVAGTDKLRLDFYEKAAAALAAEGVACVFEQRVDETSYIATLCSTPPIEVIVKNVSTGSTTRKYPGLFPEGHRFQQPVVKFDYRTDPEDQPIADDYVRELGYKPEALKDIALRTNKVLRDWLAPLDLWDFCIIVGEDSSGHYQVTSEISPDAMRLKGSNGQSFDKDLFRHGAGRQEIIETWQSLVALLG